MPVVGKPFLCIYLENLIFITIENIFLNYPIPIMDPILLFWDLPRCIQMLVTNYDPLAIFHLPISDLMKLNWYKLAKMNLGLEYSPDTCPETDIIILYYENCKIERPKMGFSEYHSVIFKNGKLMVKGYNKPGQLGLGDCTDRLLYHEVKDIPDDIEEVACGTHFTVIKLVDGTLMFSGLMYRGYNAIYINKFTKFEELTGKCIVEIKCGYNHIIIRLIDGTLMGYGSNWSGQLGLPVVTVQSTFEEIRGLPKNIVQIECGAHNTVLRLTDGTIMASGYIWSGMERSMSLYKFEKIPWLPVIEKINKLKDI